MDTLKGLNSNEGIIKGMWDSMLYRVRPILSSRDSPIFLVVPKYETRSLRATRAPSAIVAADYLLTHRTCLYPEVESTTIHAAGTCQQIDGERERETLEAVGGLRAG